MFISHRIESVLQTFSNLKDSRPHKKTVLNIFKKNLELNTMTTMTTMIWLKMTDLGKECMKSIFYLVKIALLRGKNNNPIKRVSDIQDIPK